MIGKTLGHYRVGEQLGHGGMGEVYLADDLNLNRKVALKFLPDAFAADPERMARFEREAKLLASLNHPNIAAIYGLEQAEGKRFLVLELVEGETLAQRLSKGALPLEEALGICRQIAEALEAAHEKGVIHRDLKPANVMITDGDKVKILDFGLAKALADETQSVDSSQSPTLTEAMTRPGIILGTAAYMSPEQAKGKAVDKRADIWAFGCILYECLTGKRAFEGETVTETLAAVLTREPEWEKIPATVRPLLRRCLERDAKKRLRDIGDAYALLESAPESAPVKRPWLAWSIAALAVLIAVAMGMVHDREKPSAPGAPMRFQIPLPSKVNMAPGGGIALSPDGQRLAFTAVGTDGVQRLWLRALDSFEARPLFGTESSRIPPFFWSPDSRFIAFLAGTKLKKIGISGGPPQIICDLSAGFGGSWNRDGVIILGTEHGGVMRVSSSGGVAFPLTKPNPARQESAHHSPIFLPDGKHFLYWCQSATPENQGVYIGSLDAKPEEQGSNQLVPTNFFPIYVPSTDSSLGQLLFIREQVLVAQPFDDKHLELVGEPTLVAEQVGSFGNYAFFSASTNGILVYISGGSGQQFQPTWLDRQGKVLGTAGGLGLYYRLALSPDGRFAAVGRNTRTDIWLLNFSRGTEQRFTFGQGNSSRPIWSPDGSHIIFGSDREGVYNLYQKPASGAKEEELLFKSTEHKYPTSWSSDEGFVLYTAIDQKTKQDLWLLSLESGVKAIPFLRTNFNEGDGQFSPDMRWIAYVSDESGSNEVYVRGFSRSSGSDALSASIGKWLISEGGGTGPRWRRDGKELYYRATDGKVIAVEITAGTLFQAGSRKPLFQAPPDIAALYTIAPFPAWDVTADGKRFLLPVPAVENSPSPFNVVLNWTALLKK
jgi:Tol biopolymer transport system component